VTSESVKKAMRRYVHSDKGKATRKKWVDANKEKMSGYYSIYNKRLRNRCRALGICIRCHNHEVKKGHVQCEICLERFRTKHKPKEICDQCGNPSWSLFNARGKWLCRACKK
jgi:rRNA maturation endonuclease Nob1